MISKAEIDEKAKEFEIHEANVERDYVFGWLINGLFTVSDLKDEIFLKGGNAIRKGYFSNTRFSSDLDFGIPGDISEQRLFEELNKVCDYIQSKTNVQFKTEDTKVKEKFGASDAPIPGLKVYEARIYFKDFYGKQDHLTIKVSMDITRFDKVLLPIQELDLIHPYSDSEEIKCRIRCMKLEEIIATKLKCLLQRQHAPDLFDYVHTFKQLGVNLNREEIVEAFVAKTIFRPNPHVLKKILQNTAFDFFRNMWSKAIVCAKKIILDVEEAINIFLLDLTNLFSIYPENDYASFAFFESEFRIPIMKAAREQTMLKVIYNGAERLIEPYSLKYMQRRDGREREYFYAYNVEGGNNSPGIRAFVADGFESIENTEEKFEPRFSIELSKAGEKPENPYLFDLHKPIAERQSQLINLIRGSGRPTSTKPYYVYQCSFCGKKFDKSTQKSVLNPHKNKNGYACSGRQGFYVTTKYK